MAKFNVTTGLPQLPVTGKEEEFRLVLPLYNAVNAVAQALSVISGNVEYSQAELAAQNQVGTLRAQTQNKLYVLAMETIPYGRLVNIQLSAGKLAGRMADATNNTKPAHGICNNTAGIAAGEYGEIIVMQGHSDGISGTAVGTYYYLATTGLTSATRPTAGGTIVQAVGFGLGSAGFYLSISSIFGQN